MIDTVSYFKNDTLKKFYSGTVIMNRSNKHYVSIIKSNLILLKIIKIVTT